MKKKFKVLFTSCFSAAAGALVLIGLVAFHNVANYIDSNNWVQHTYHVLSELDVVSALLRDAESGQRGYLITGDPVSEPL
jgi:CHASE3 domain sensor protein